MRIKGLVEVIICTLFEGESPFGCLTHLSQQNGGRPYIRTAQAAQYFTPIHAWHEDIENNQFGVMSLRFFKGIHPIRDHQYVKARALQKRRETIRDGGIIVSEEEG